MIKKVKCADQNRVIILERLYKTMEVDEIQKDKLIVFLVNSGTKKTAKN